MYEEPARLKLELAGKAFPVAHDAPPSGIVAPFEVSVKAEVALPDPDTTPAPK